MSFSIHQIRQEYQRLDQICGVAISRIPLRISKRAGRQHGACCLSGNPSAPVKYISIAAFIMGGDDERLFLHTIRHEYAHALVAIRFPHERHKHDKVWKAACQEIGCPADRCAAVSKEYLSHVQQAAKYTVTCSHCKQRWHFFRAGKIVSLLRHNPQFSGASCPVCGHSHFILTEAVPKRA